MSADALTPEAFARAYDIAISRMREWSTATVMIPSALQVRAELRREDINVSCGSILDFAREHGITLSDADAPPKRSR